jgi:Holliday junction resolvase RusA-like endonuclease
MEIILKGRIPSKKNSKYLIYRGGRPYFVPSPAYKQWHEEQSWMLKKYTQKHPISKCDITIIMYAPDNRKSDLSNKVESIMDLLVDMKIIEDDNWFVVPNLVLKFAGVDKENPRAIIKIEAPSV